MIYTHTIGRIGAKDCRVITGTHGTFMAVDIAVDDYWKIQCKLPPKTKRFCPLVLK